MYQYLSDLLSQLASFSSTQSNTSISLLQKAPLMYLLISQLDRLGKQLLYVLAQPRSQITKGGGQKKKEAYIIVIEFKQRSSSRSCGIPLLIRGSQSNFYYSPMLLYQSFQNQLTILFSLFSLSYLSSICQAWNQSFSHCLLRICTRTKKQGDRVGLVEKRLVLEQSE